MNRGWRYRLTSVAGTVVLVVVAAVVTNLQGVHEAFAQVPYFGRPAPEPLASGDLQFAVVTTLLVVLASMWPLFKPRPRRILDTILLTQERVVLAMLGLAALGYFNYSYRLPRTTLMLTTASLLVALPLFMAAVRRPQRSSSRAIIVGDDPDAMESLLAASALPVLGYVSPPSAYAPDGIEPERISATDGGKAADRLDELPCLGGLARLDEVVVEHDVDTVLLAFSATDREEFFGTLEACHDHGVQALVHQDHADHVLTDDFTGESLLRVDLEPWDWQDHVLKRLFDVAFAAVALLVLLPVILLVSVAIKIDDGGPILYSQERTAAFGRTFEVHKFRSMTPDTEDTAPDSEEEYRVTRAGRVLRKTHLDEIPQLWAILTGKMSVVGPRATWTDEELLLEAEADAWRKRWFIKPGLTGLAQINDASSAEPEEKLRYDLLYIRQQSFWFDLKIVVRQLWSVGTDMIGFLLPGGDGGSGQAGPSEGDSESEPAEVDEEDESEPESAEADEDGEASGESAETVESTPVRQRGR